MNENRKNVIFANKKFEEDYEKLAVSKHPEDKKLYSVLKRIRSKLRWQYLAGKEVPINKIPAVYKRLFDIDNLWRIDISRNPNVLYSIVGNEIWIVDMPWGCNNLF